MAPNSRRLPPSATTNRPTSDNAKFNSLESFLGVYGNAEYALYKKANPTPHLPYDDWATSEHVLGPYLYHLTLDAWDEATSSVSQ